MKTLILKQHLLPIMAIFLLPFLSNNCLAGKVAVTIHPDRENALYQCGEEATFTINVNEDGGQLTQGSLSVKLSLDGGKNIATKVLKLTGRPIVIKGTLKEPGFLRCNAVLASSNFKKKPSGCACVGYEPEKIKPAVNEPDDFMAFWKKGIARQAAIPLDLKKSPDSKFSTDKVDVYRISFAVLDNSRMHGFLCIPKNKKEAMPVFLITPGAGPGMNHPSLALSYAKRGAIGLALNIHKRDFSTDSADEIKENYKKLNQGTRYMFKGAPDAEAYYFRRVILGLNRAVDYLASRSDFDGEHLVVEGSSQGGAMALILAGLNHKITAASASMPAMCDHAAYLAGRSPGWPKLVSRQPAAKRKQFQKMADYYDTVNFARHIQCPVLVGIGFLDKTSYPSPVYAAYNVIQSPKQIINGPKSGHQWRIGNFRKVEYQWLHEKLGVSTP
jgi:cephalosporin-C deacetylase-like acetyl esterase